MTPLAGLAAIGIAFGITKLPRPEKPRFRAPGKGEWCMVDPNDPDTLRDGRGDISMAKPLACFKSFQDAIGFAERDDVIDLFQFQERGDTGFLTQGLTADGVKRDVICIVDDPQSGIMMGGKKKGFQRGTAQGNTGLLRVVQVRGCENRTKTPGGRLAG
jgi:hypothetical protein